MNYITFRAFGELINAIENARFGMLQDLKITR
jgi:hypothetical protein